MNPTEVISEILYTKPIWSSASAAAKWILETLLRRQHETTERATDKWNQVADYLDKVADIVDKAVRKYRMRQIPDIEYAQLVHLDDDFEAILKQVFSDDTKIAKCVEAYREALYLCSELDDLATKALARRVFSNSTGKEAIENLIDVSGKFRAVALSIRAQA